MRRDCSVTQRWSLVCPQLWPVSREQTHPGGPVNTDQKWALPLMPRHQKNTGNVGQKMLEI